MPSARTGQDLLGGAGIHDRGGEDEFPVRHWRPLLIAVAVIVVAAPRVAAEESPPGIYGTYVQGPCLGTGPHSYDLFTGAVECVGWAKWEGTFSGSGLLRAKGWIDPITGNSSGQMFVRITSANGDSEIDLVGPFEINGTSGKQVSTLTIVRAAGTFAHASGPIFTEGTSTLSGIEAVGGYQNRPFDEHPIDEDPS